jgi:SH3 domain-containing protein
VRRALALLTLLAPWAGAQQPSTPAQPALPNSPLLWEVREGNHPRMGPITVAVPEQSVVTPVGKEKILSLVFFSCEKTAGRIAIELANAAESDARSGLYPKQMPKLFCNPRSSAPRTELPATWYVSEIGDALARGLAPSDLRRCASIEIQQDIALPRGWGPETQRVDIEVIPYKKELDAVLATCAVAQPHLRAEAPKAAPAPMPAAAPPPKAAPMLPTPAPPVPKLAAVPAPAKTPAPVEAPWRTVHVVATGGRTNVRASPTTDSPIVIALDAGAVVQVQPTGTDWWRARSANGAGFAGYIRQDRLLLR